MIPGVDLGSTGLGTIYKGVGSQRLLPVTVEIDPCGVWQGNPLFCLTFLLSLKLECEKLASEKTEMQRHYVMVRGTCPNCPPHVLPKKGQAGISGTISQGAPPILRTACLSHLSEPNRDPSCGFPVWVPIELRVFVSCPDTHHSPHPRLHPISVPRVAPAVHTGQDCLLCSTMRCPTDSTLRCTNR